MSKDDDKGPLYKETKQIPAFRGDTAEHALMGEMIRGFEAIVQKSVESLRVDMQKEVRAVNTKLQNHYDVSMKAHEDTRQHVVRLTQMVKVLWASVKGSDPPPPPPSGVSELSFAMSEPVVKASGTAPLDEQVSSHDESLASIQGQLIAVDASQNETKAQVTELLRLQREQMGKHEKGKATIRRMADTVGWLLTTTDGRKSLMLFVVFTAVVYEKFRSLLHL